jgi:hypothetical protein
VVVSGKFTAQEMYARASQLEDPIALVRSRHKSSPEHARLHLTSNE